MLVERGLPRLLTRRVGYRTMLSIVAVPKRPVMVRHDNGTGGPVVLIGDAAGLWHTPA